MEDKITETVDENSEASISNETATETTTQASSKQNTTNTQVSGKPANKQGLIGLGLVGIGLLAVLTNIGDETGFLWTGMISAIMFFAYYRTKAYGLLIPACILAGVTVGIIFELLSPVEGVFLLGLGGGFVAIDRIQQEKSRWPLYPGIVLMAIGTVITIQTLFNNMLFALMLIVIGAFLLLRNRQVLDSMVDVKADIDVRFGKDEDKTYSFKTDNAKDDSETKVSKSVSSVNLDSDIDSGDSEKDNSVRVEVSESDAKAKTVVVDIMSEDSPDSVVKNADSVVKNDADKVDEVIEIDVKSTDENVQDLDDAVSSIKKAVDKIVEDANLPKDNS